MIHKIMVFIVRRFLKKTQAWVNRTPGCTRVSMNFGEGIIVIVKGKREKC